MSAILFTSSLAVDLSMFYFVKFINLYDTNFLIKQCSKSKQ